MSSISLTLTARVAGKPDWIEISPNGRWVALNFHGNWRLFNALIGVEHASLLLNSHWAVIANDGKHIATLTEGELKIVGVNGTERRARFPKPEDPLMKMSGDLIFSSDGSQLWLAINDEHERGKVAVINVATLAMVDSLPMPIDKDNSYSEGLTQWLEPQMVLHEQSNTMAITHSGGDSYLGTFFFRFIDGRIQQLPAFIAWDNGIDYLRPLLYPCFSASGHYFAAYDGPFLNMWRLPQLQLIGDGCAELVDWDESESLSGLTFLGDNPVIVVENSAGEYELRAIQVEEKDCSCVATATVQAPIDGPMGTEMMKRTTLVAVSGRETLIYLLSLE